MLATPDQTLIAHHLRERDAQPMSQDKRTRPAIPGETNATRLPDPAPCPPWCLVPDLTPEAAKRLAALLTIAAERAAQ